MKYCHWVSLLCLIFSSWGGAQETAVKNSIEFKKIAGDFRAKHQIPGLGIAVGHGNKDIYAAGLGMSDLENRVKATEDTVFRVASIAKPMTAVAVLQLVEQGKIELHDPINKHCPEFPEMENGPSIRDILCHQGGIRHYQSPGESTGKKPFFTIKDSLSLFKDDALKFESGTRFGYTTYGYSLLGRAIETASGMSYRDYMQKNIFDRAGMKSAGIDDYFRIIPNRTRGYTKLSKSMRDSLPKELQKHMTVGAVYNCQLHDTSMKIPGGGLICSPTDLVKFGQAMLENKLISKATREQAWVRQKTKDGKFTEYGLGWKVDNDGIQLISHSGGQAGTSTMLIILPEHDLVVAGMCNLQNAPTLRLVREIGESIIETQSK